MRVLKYVVGLLVLAGAGFFAFIYFSGGSGEPSTSLTTPTIAGGTTGASGSGTQFVIVPEESTASFSIFEVLRGADNTVLGTTHEVAGQVQIDPADPSSAQISEIVINARTFVTDSSNRDRAIRSPIVLDSAGDDFEFIRFMPTAIEGLSGPIEVGQEVSFTVTGDLSIKGTTQSVLFDVTAVLETDDRLSGQASTEVTRADFGIGIPNAPGVASVGEEVQLTFDFVAVRS